LVVGGEVDTGPDLGPEPAGDFRITSIEAFSVTEIQLVWTSVAGGTYAVETSADGEIWQDSRTDIGATADETTSTIERSDALRLIRVRRQ